jgi:hypothetical protein
MLPAAAGPHQILSYLLAEHRLLTLTRTLRSDRAALSTFKIGCVTAGRPVLGTNAWPGDSALDLAGLSARLLPGWFAAQAQAAVTARR